MKLGFVSAILGDLTLEEVLAYAGDEGFECVELMCWPPGTSDRRYAGVCHVDVTQFDDGQAHRVKELTHIHGVSISGLGYYPNPLDSDPAHRAMVVGHLRKVMAAAAKLGVGVVNTFIGRDSTKSVDANWPLFQQVWPPLVREAESLGIKIGLENCPMLFTEDEWPGGKNLATTPALWQRIFADLKSSSVGLNFDPSHLIWQRIDPARCIRDFGSRIVHVHAKDTRIDADKLYAVGGQGLGWHTAKIPGLGDVNWGAFFSALTDAQYTGPVCIEVEDRAFEGSLADRKRSLRQSKRFLEQYIV
jgi:sugar phosphate isomerase/epimerase